MELYIKVKVGVKRTADFLDKYATRVESGDLQRELIGVYYLSEDSTDSTYTSTLTSDSTGTITIKGLDVGKYTLVETKAADGYNLDSSEITIELTDEDLDGLLDDNNDDNGIYELTVYNKTGFTLPTTGGIGTTIFVAIGVVLVVAGLSMIVISSKKKKNNA